MKSDDKDKGDEKRKKGKRKQKNDDMVTILIRRK